MGFVYMRTCGRARGKLERWKLWKRELNSIMDILSLKWPFGILNRVFLDIFKHGLKLRITTGNINLRVGGR